MSSAYGSSTAAYASMSAARPATAVPSTTSYYGRGVDASGTSTMPSSGHSTARSTTTAASTSRPHTSRSHGSTSRTTPLSRTTTTRSSTTTTSSVSGEGSGSSSTTRGAIPSAGPSPSRVQKLFGLASVTQGEPYSSSRLAYIPAEILRVTAEEQPAKNVLQPGKKTYWSTGTGANHELVFKISSACLLGFVKIFNKSTSHIEIYVAMHDVANQYVRIQTDNHSPHNKTIMYPCGFLPCRYVKVKCVRGTPCALYNVSMVGVLERVVWREMGPQMGSMIVEHPESLLRPAKPDLRTQASLTFPAHQTIKQQPMEPQPPIKECNRTVYI